MEGVSIGSYHHGHFLQGISSSSKLSPVDAVLVTAAVMPATVPHAVQIGMSAGIIPPSSLLVVGTVTFETQGIKSDQLVYKQSGLLLVQGLGLGLIISKPSNGLSCCFHQILHNWNFCVCVHYNNNTHTHTQQ